MRSGAKKIVQKQGQMFVKVSMTVLFGGIVFLWCTLSKKYGTSSLNTHGVGEALTTVLPQFRVELQ